MTIYYCWGCNSWITRDDIETNGQEEVHMNCYSNELQKIKFNNPDELKRWLNDNGDCPRECLCN